MKDEEVLRYIIDYYYKWLMNFINRCLHKGGDLTRKELTEKQTTPKKSDGVCNRTSSPSGPQKT